MEITKERNEPAQRRPSPHRCSNEPDYADSAPLPRYAGAMKIQKNTHALNCALLIASAAIFLIPFETFARQSAATPNTQASSATQPKDELRVSAYTKHEDLKLKVADLKSMPRTTVSVHNEHSKADETYTGVRLADLLVKMGAPLGHDLRGVALSGYIVATGSDGYVAVIALAEVDPGFHSGEVIVADTMNGEALDPKSGPFKLVVTEDKRPARWVRNLVSVELKSAK
jgi:DMSO/TMAO reductase YedYZ molybdopterin-dependent catalytic subunit